MKLYRIRHIPTGLFWRPAASDKRDQLHKTGKIYSTKAQLHWIAGDSYNKWTFCDVKGQRKRYPLSEFDVVEFKVNE